MSGLEHMDVLDTYIHTLVRPRQKVHSFFANYDCGDGRVVPDIAGRAAADLKKHAVTTVAEER